MTIGRARFEAASGTVDGDSHRVGLHKSDRNSKDGLAAMSSLGQMLCQEEHQGIEELQSLLAAPVPDCTPPSQNLLGSPPKRDIGAANPLVHCSSWTRMAPISSRSNLEMLGEIHGDKSDHMQAAKGEDMGLVLKKQREEDGARMMDAASADVGQQRDDGGGGLGKSMAIPVPAAPTRCSSARWVPSSASSPEARILA